VIVGFSGGVTSAWCLGWALSAYPREEVIALFHDTKEEHPDTYRFLKEMAAALGVEITERSDGRSVTQLFRDEDVLGNNQQTMCSRILKAEQGEKYVGELRRMISPDLEIIKVIGYSANEPKRVNRMVGYCAASGITARFPIIETGTTKQECADWCVAQGVQPSAMYCWAEHANCVGCVKGARTYWLAVAKHHPEVYEQRAQLEEEFGHTINRGGNPITLRALLELGTKHPFAIREKIDLGACECGD